MAATKLDIAQGKARKNSAVSTKHSAAGAEGDTTKASVASHHKARASYCSEDATTYSAASKGGIGKASTASTRAKCATTCSAASEGNTGASASLSSAKGITSLSAAVNEGATGPLCTASSTTTHSNECEQYGVGNQGVEDYVNTGCAEGEGAATHSAEAEGNAPPQFSASVNTDRFEYVLVSLSKEMVPISDVNIMHWFYFSEVNLQFFLQLVRSKIHKKFQVL